MRQFIQSGFFVQRLRITARQQEQDIPSQRYNKAAVKNESFVEGQQQVLAQ